MENGSTTPTTHTHTHTHTHTLFSEVWKHKAEVAAGTDYILRCPWCLGSDQGSQRKITADPDAEVCLHTLRLIQSVVLEPDVFSKVASELQSSLPLQRILAMSKSRNSHLQSAAQELLEDLRALDCNV